MTTRIRRLRRPGRQYHYRGMIERGADYHWVEGYSTTAPDGSIYYPWMTKRECQQAAKANGEQAVFYHNGREARR